MAIAEDLRTGGDVTSEISIAPDSQATCTIVQKQPGVICGLPLVPVICREIDPNLTFQPLTVDGDFSSDRRAVGTLVGATRSILAAERTVLNFLGLLSGIASKTREFVVLTKDTPAEIYDTRKTIPGYRELSKYAVRAGGARNHRMAMDDMVLVKDNHLASIASRQGGSDAGTSADWLERAAAHIVAESRARHLPVEIEVDDLDQFRRLLTVAGIDVVLLDNMNAGELTEAVAMREAAEHRPILEASGGVSLETVAAISRTGVERIAVGAITHSATNLDVGLDFGR